MNLSLWLRRGAAVAFVCLCALLCAASAQSQTVACSTSGGTGYTQITASYVGGRYSPLTAGKIYFQPVRSISGPGGAAQAGGGGQILGTACYANVTAGAASFYVPDALAANPNICYAATVLDNYGNTIIGSGMQAYGMGVNFGGPYGCLQPTGTSWSLDVYIPSTPVTVLPASLFATPTATAGGSAAASISLLNSGQYQISFTLPQGPTGPASTVPGPAGATGAPATWGGVYNGSTTYNTVGEQVSYSDGATYVNLQTGNTGNTPGSSPSWWQVANPAASVSVAQQQQLAQIGTPSPATQGISSPTSSGMNVSANQTLFSQAAISQSGTITGVSFVTGASGTITFLVASKSGSAMTVVQSFTVSVASGSTSLTNLSIPAVAGQYFGVYSPTGMNIFFKNGGGTTGMYFCTGLAGSGTTVTANNTDDAQFNWTVTATPLGNRLVADEANITTAIAGVMTTSQQQAVAVNGPPTQTSQGAPTPAAVGNSTRGFSLISQTPASASGAITSLTINTTGATTLTIFTANIATSLGTASRVSSQTLTTSATSGTNTYNGLYIPIQAGQYVGVEIPSTPTISIFFATSGGPGIWTYSGLLGTSGNGALTPGAGDLAQFNWTITTTPLLLATQPYAGEVLPGPVLAASGAPVGFVNGDSWPCGYGLLTGAQANAYSNLTLAGMGVPLTSITPICESGTGMEWIANNQINLSSNYSGQSITSNSITITDGMGNDSNTNTEPVWQTMKQAALALIVDAGTIDPQNNTSGVAAKQFASTAVVSSGTGGTSTHYPIKGETCSSGPCTFTWSNVTGRDIYILVEVDNGSSYNPSVTVDGVSYTGTWSSGSWLTGVNEPTISQTWAPWPLHITSPSNGLHTVALTLPTGKTAIEVIGSGADKSASGPQVIATTGASAPFTTLTQQQIDAPVTAWEAAVTEAQMSGFNVFFRDTQDIATLNSPFVTFTYNGSAVAAALIINITGGVWQSVTLDPNYTAPNWCLNSSLATATALGSGTGATLTVTCASSGGSIQSINVTNGGSNYDPVQLFSTLYSHPNLTLHALLAQALLAKVNMLNNGRNSDVASGTITNARECDAYANASVVLMPYCSLSSVMLSSSTVTSWIDPGRPGQQTKLQVCSPNGTDVFTFPANVFYGGATSATDTPANGKCDMFILTMTGQVDSSVANYWYATKL
jgi:hypothetical protein